KFPQTGPVHADHAHRSRARDVSLYVGLDRTPQGRRAFAPEPYLGGRAAHGRAGHDPPSFSGRRPPLSYECARYQPVGACGPRNCDFAPAVYDATLPQGPRGLSLHMAYGRSAMIAMMLNDKE